MRVKNILLTIFGILIVSIALGSYIYFSGITSKQIYRIRMVDYAYSIEDGGLPLKLRANTEYTFEVVNIGKFVHELMIVRDNKDRVIGDLKSLVSRLISEGYEGEELLEEIELLHHELEEEWEEAGILFFKIELNPGEEGLMNVEFSEPGEYWMICLELEGTAPDPHYERGMVAKIIVE